MLYIGIDLGTSACKFLLVDESGAVLNEVTREYPRRSHPGGAGGRGLRYPGQL